jgi:hypothetical protein
VTDVNLPTITVQKQIRRQIFANASRPRKVNDLRDLDALAVAVPTCDVVVGDRAAIDALVRSQVVRALGTRLIPPEELVAVLDEEKHRQGSAAVGPRLTASGRSVARCRLRRRSVSA